LTGNGGTGPYVFVLTAGSLPAGLSLSNGGVISGTPTSSGKSTFTVGTTEANGCSGTQNYSVQIDCPTITIKPATLPNGLSKSPYSETLTGNGGTGPYVFVLTAGSLPAGLSLSNAGVISGTPTSSGKSTFTVGTTEANGCSGSQNYSLQIDCPTITITPATLPNGLSKSPYSETLSGSGGTDPYTFVLTGGSLPAGLSLSTGGVISGTPTGSGKSTFTVGTTDANGCSGTQNYSIQVECPTITINPA